ncbi:MAG: transposase [Okeania sp. SIO3B5]|uniref:zinc ribbon domain-containing protein n=1 Tax=Okeania sp. SIO3B5 TaxID=2607811 RepID=UPI001400968A|nr:transposase [Okeania sp. SIO3B5]
MLEVKTIVVNPQKQSQNCSNCGEKVPKKLPEITHSCANCCVIIDRDLFAQHSVGNAAINIKNRAVGHSVFKARACPTGYRDSRNEKPTLYLKVGVGVCHSILTNQFTKNLSKKEYVTYP